MKYYCRNVRAIKTSRNRRLFGRGTPERIIVGQPESSDDDEDEDDEEVDEVDDEDADDMI